MRRSRRRLVATSTATALKTNLADIAINWQVVIGMTNSPTSEWSQIPLGSVAKFGDQLAALTAALGSDADAASALSYMSGANDIVQRGLGGDSTAQADLAAYMGTDVGANVGKQLPISIAYHERRMQVGGIRARRVLTR